MGKDVRRIRAFDHCCKIEIKMDVETDKLIELMYSENDDIKTRNKQDAIMMQDVIGECLFRGGVHTFLKTFDGINVFHIMSDIYKKEIYL